ncbi:MAG: thiol protease/hemagglutinin PrtT [Clostridium sp.]|nr:thiol protease/hemagglutinin PrtT [Clostridium sp.]
MRNSIRILLATAALATTTIASNARELSPSEALELILPKDGMTSPGTEDETPELLHTLTCPSTGAAALYVFDRGEDRGFYVVAADDLVGNLLLGYADNGAFSDQMNPEMEWWLGNYTSEIETIRSLPASVLQNRVRRRASTTAEEDTRPDILPIMHSGWHQTEPFNDKCPYPSATSTERCPAGCVALAMGEVMQIHRWPLQGTGYHEYTCYTIGEILSCDFSATTFDWDNILNNYYSGGSAVQRNAAATLLYALGVSVNMSYSRGASGANFQSAARALLTYFDYDRGMQILERPFYGLDEWNDILYNELAHGRPVLYGGQNNEGGHAFVLDGYRSGGYFHVNWGWSEMSNGYYLTTALDPLEQGVGGSSSGYNVDQSMIIGVQPPVEGSSVIPGLRFVNGFATAEESHARTASGSVPFSDSRGIFNCAIDRITVTPGVRLVGQTGDTTWLASTEPVSLEYQSGFRSYFVPDNLFPTEGTYTVTPAFRDSAGVWHDSRVFVNGVHSLTLTATPSILQFASDDAPALRAEDLALATEIVIGSKFGLRATLVADGGEYYGEIRPILSRNGTIVSRGAFFNVDIPEGEGVETEIVSEFSTTISTGTYELYLQDSKSQVISDPIEVTVSPEVVVEGKTTATVELENTLGGEGTETAPWIIDMPEFSALITVDGEAGYSAEMVSGYIYEGNSLKLTLQGSFVGVRAGQKAYVRIADDLSELTPDPVYKLIAYGSTQKQIGDPVWFVDRSAAVGAAEIREKLRVTPNPMADCAEVVSDTPMAEIALISLGGTEMTRIVVDSQTEATVDVSMLPPGVYMLEVTGADRSTATLKVLKR